MPGITNLQSRTRTAIAVLICGLCALPTVAAQQDQSSDLQRLVREVEDRCDCDVILRTDDSGRIVSHVVCHSFGPKKSLKWVSTLPSVTELIVDIDIDELPDLLQLTDLRRLQLRVISHHDLTIESLNALHRLEWLKLGGDAVGPQLIASLQNLPHLTHLALEDIPLPDEVLENLAKLRPTHLSLRAEHAVGKEATVRRLEYIGRMDSLEALSLDLYDFRQTHFDRTHLETLSGLPRLRKLAVGPYTNWKDGHFEVLARFPALQHLKLSGLWEPTLTEARIASLSKAPALNLLEAGAHPELKKNAARMEASLPDVRIVAYGPVTNPLSVLTNPGIEAFRIVQKVPIGISMFDTTTDSHFQHYYILERRPIESSDLSGQIRSILESRQTYNAEGGGGGFIPGLGLRFTEGDNVVDVLVCKRSRLVIFEEQTDHLIDTISDAAADWYVGTINSFANNELADIYLRLFGKRAEGLTFLQADSSTNDDEFASTLNKMLKRYPNDGYDTVRQIIGMDLSNSEITDHSLKIIPNINGLEELRLANTQVSDVGIQYLLSLKQLRLLDVSNTNITLAGQRTLRRQLPNTIILPKP